MTRRQALASLSILFGLPGISAGYGFGIEPYMVKTHEIDIRIKGFNTSLKAVHLSDLHMSSVNARMKKVTELTNRYDADYIFLTGDLVDKKENLNRCLDWLTTLKCRNQIFFVAGNWEHWSGTIKENLDEKLREIGISMLFNAGTVIEHKNFSFFLAGTDDAFSGSPRPLKTFSTCPENMHRILLSHSPVGVQIGTSFNCCLVLAGHTHGGQVRLPFYGPLWTPPGSGGFDRGLYQVGDTQMYVTSGIGMSLVPVRFFCPPEVAWIRISGF